MTLSHSARERLLTKSQWVETRSLPAFQLACLAAGEAQKMGLKVWSSDKISLLQSEGSIGSSLAPRGHSFCAQGTSLFALSHAPEKLLSWHLPTLELIDEKPLAGAATLLSCDPRGRWVSWVTATPGYQVWTQGLVSDSVPHLFANLAAAPYALSWHPFESLCLLILCPLARTPWQAARLILAAYAGEKPQLCGELSLSPPGFPDAACQEASFSADGREVLGLWRCGEWNQLWTYNLEDKSWQALSADERERGRPRRRSDEQSFVSVGQELIGISHQRGYFRLDCLDRKSGLWRELLPQHFTHLEQIHPSADGNAISLIAASAQMPPTQLELHRVEDNWQLARQRGLPAPIQAWSVQGEAVSWPSEDGHLVQGFLYRDRRRRSGPLPLLLPIHDGPTEQVTANWPVKAQAMVESGYAVLYINYRGSWGYGRSYQEALAGHWGHRELKDIVSSIKPLAAAGWIDPQRVALWGGGFGGSIVLRALQLYPQVFRAGIAVYPLCDFADYWERAQALQRAELDATLATDEAEARRRLSPLASCQSIVTPLALFHGAKDPLVPEAHVQAIAASLEARRIPCWLTVYEEEGHAWQARATLEDYYLKVGSFLARFLRKEG